VFEDHAFRGAPCDELCFGGKLGHGFELGRKIAIGTALGGTEEQSICHSP
jgi:hypothetical protein